MPAAAPVPGQLAAGRGLVAADPAGDLADARALAAKPGYLIPLPGAKVTVAANFPSVRR